MLLQEPSLPSSISSTCGLHGRRQATWTSNTAMKKEVSFLFHSTRRRRILFILWLNRQWRWWITTSSVRVRISFVQQQVFFLHFISFYRSQKKRTRKAIRFQSAYEERNSTAYGNWILFIVVIYCCAGRPPSCLGCGCCLDDDDDEQKGGPSPPPGGGGGVRMCSDGQWRGCRPNVLPLPIDRKRDTCQSSCCFCFISRH